MNYLDLPAIIWLQSYLTEGAEHGLVVVSHNRIFSDTVTHETVTGS